MAAFDFKPKDGRLLAVVLLLIVLMAVYLFAVHWWFVAPQLDYSAQMSDLREQQQRYGAIIAERPMIEQRLSEVAAFEQGNQAFLSETDINAASAALIQRLKQSLAESSDDPTRCTSVSQQSYSGGEEELYKRITIQARLRCDMESLADVLYDLENGKPYLFIDQVMIFKQQTYTPPGGKVVVTPLDVRFNLSGYVRQPGKAPQ